MEGETKLTKFATAINCIDGRAQTNVTSHIKENYGVDYVDMVTMPGVIKILAYNRNSNADLIKRHVEISVIAHHSKLVAVVGHHDCAGNPVCKESQLENLAAAIKVVESWCFDVEIVGLWVDENWKVCMVR
jgi:carbonic anhydrase